MEAPAGLADRLCVCSVRAARLPARFTSPGRFSQDLGGSDACRIRVRTRSLRGRRRLLRLRSGGQLGESEWEDCEAENRRRGSPRETSVSRLYQFAAPPHRIFPCPVLERTTKQGGLLLCHQRFWHQRWHRRLSEGSVRRDLLHVSTTGQKSG